MVAITVDQRAAPLEIDAIAAPHKAADCGDIGGFERFGQFRQPVRLWRCVIVYKGEDLAARLTDADIARL